MKQTGRLSRWLPLREYGSSFAPTPRLAIWVGGAVLISWLGVGKIANLSIRLIFDVLLFMVASIDWWSSPKPRCIVVKRQVAEIMSCGAANAVALQLSNTSATQLAVEVRDEPPVCFECKPSLLKAKINPNSQVTIDYEAKPAQRGEHSFKGITYRFNTRLKLWRWQARVDAGQTVRVYPDITLLKQHYLLSQHSHLHEAGVKQTNSYGSGSEFDSVREYAPDDEPRIINWQATARRGRLMVNQYRETRNEAVMLMIDAGRLGAALVGKLTRTDHAINAALLLAYTAITHGDHVGCLVFADEVMAYLPCRGGQQQLRLFTKTLYNVSPRLVEADYQAACSYLRRYQHKRSLVCMFSDLVEAETAWVIGRELRRLKPYHLPMCVAIMDSELVDMANAVPNGSEAVYKKAAALQTVVSRNKVAQTLRRQGVVTLDAPPARINTVTINTYLQIKSSAQL